MALKGYFPQNSSVTRTSTSECLVSYPGDSFKGSLNESPGYDPSSEMQSVYSIAPTDWAESHLGWATIYKTRGSFLHRLKKYHVRFEDMSAVIKRRRQYPLQRCKTNRKRGERLLPKCCPGYYMKLHVMVSIRS